MRNTVSLSAAARDSWVTPDCRRRSAVICSRRDGNSNNSVRRRRFTTRSSLGTFDVSALVWQNWQIRADAGVNAEPSLRLNTASVLLDGTLADDNTVRLG